MAKIDEIDRKLITELLKDGRNSYTVLAQKLGISVSSVSRRMARLLDEGAINITISTDQKKLGYESMAIIALNCDLNKVDDVCNTLKQYPSIGLMVISFGRFDILATVRYPTSIDMANFIKNNLAKIDGIHQVETFYIAELKQSGFMSL